MCYNYNMIYLLCVILLMSSVYLVGLWGSRAILKRLLVEQSIIDEKSRFDFVNYMFLVLYTRLWKDGFKLSFELGVPLDIYDVLSIISWYISYQLFSNWIYIKHRDYRRISLIVYLILSNVLYVIHCYY